MGKVHDSKKTENTSPMYSVSQEITCGETRLDDKWRAVHREVYVRFGGEFTET